VKRFVCTILTCSLAALLIACDSRQGSDQQPSTPAATAKLAGVITAPVAADIESPFPGAGNYVIDLAPGNISIRANQVNELEILDGIAAQAGFRLLTGDVAWGTVTVDIQKDTLHAALVELIKAYPYLIVYTPDKDTRQEVLSKVVVGDMLATETADSDAATAAGDEAPLESLDELSDPGQQAYLQELQSPFWEVRARAVEEIEPVGDALHVLTDLIVNDPSPEVRIATTRALEFSEDPLAIQALAACLKDEDLYVVIECITTLEHIGDATTVVHLQPLLMHYDETVRNTAARAIQTLQ
jgi:hypothetical protein